MQVIVKKDFEKAFTRGKSGDDFALKIMFNRLKFKYYRKVLHLRAFNC